MKAIYVRERQLLFIPSDRRNPNTKTSLPFSNSLVEIFKGILLFKVQYKGWLGNENKWSQFIDIAGKSVVLLLIASGYTEALCWE